MAGATIHNHKGSPTAHASVSRWSLAQHHFRVLSANQVCVVGKCAKLAQLMFVKGVGYINFSAVSLCDLLLPAVEVYHHRHSLRFSWSLLNVNMSLSCHEQLSKVPSLWRLTGHLRFCLTPTTPTTPPVHHCLPSWCQLCLLWLSSACR